MEDFIARLKPLLLNIGLAAVGIGVFLLLCRYGMQWYYSLHDRRHPRPVAPPPAESTGDSDDGTIPLATRSSLRKWKVSGVEKSTGNDATWLIDAESRANAKVKAELKGMIVTAVELAPRDM